MLSIKLILLAILALVNASLEYTPTPHGYMRSDCVHGVPNGSKLSRHPETRTLLVHDKDNQFIREIPKCDMTKGPLYRTNNWALPPDYDGWTAYTAYKTPTATFDAFLGNFSVPDAPETTPDMFFLFTGLQNIDWIPKVDPEPSTGFDIIQPVLQYPADAGDYFSVKSWYVTTDIGTVWSTEVVVDSGDTIFGNMTRTGPTSWYIGSTSLATGKVTELNVDHTRLENQPWAYNTLEMYGAQDCSTYPTQPVLFSDLQLYAQGKLIPADKVKWKVNPKNAQEKFCKEVPVVNRDGTVTIRFK